MKAAILEAYNSPFRIADIARPAPAKGQVLVRVQASGINPLDTKIRAGGAPHAQHPLPEVLGLDLAGTVAAVGEGVSGFKVGDEVYGLTGGVGGHQGSLAQYAAVDARLLAEKPSNLSMREAAAVPLVFITAWEGLVDRAQVRPGMKVLVQGGGGGVGHMAIQIARAFGADVFATDRGTKSHFIRSLGADRHRFHAREYRGLCGAKYRRPGFRPGLRYRRRQGAGCFFRGGEAVRPRGQLPGMGRAFARAAVLQGGDVLRRVHAAAASDWGGREHHGEIMRQATKLAEAGKLTPCVDPRRFSLDTLEDAFTAVANGQNSGKVVVEID